MKLTALDMTLTGHKTSTQTNKLDFGMNTQADDHDNDDDFKLKKCINPFSSVTFSYKFCMQMGLFVWL